MELIGLFKRYERYIVFFVITAVLLTVLYGSRDVLLPFMLGLVMAYLFMPIIRWLERTMPGKGKHMATKRALSIVLVMFAIMVVFAAGAFLTTMYVIHSGSQMLSNASEYLNNLVARGKEWTASIRNMFPAGMRDTVDNYIQGFTNSLASTLSGSAPSQGGVSFITGALGLLLGFAAVPVFLFYILKDSELCVNSVCSVLGESKKPQLRSILSVLERVLGQYIRAELALSAVLFTLTFIGLSIIRVPLALPLAFIYGLGELIPTFGAWIAGGIMLIVVLALAPDKLLWVIGMDLGVKLLENVFLVPRIEAKFMNLHPALVIVLLVLGSHFWGLWGMVLTVPLAATLIELFKWVKSLDQVAGEALPEGPEVNEAPVLFAPGSN
jgi:predicted PurR-regulated permease PerM